MRHLGQLGGAEIGEPRGEAAVGARQRLVLGQQLVLGPGRRASDRRLEYGRGNAWHRLGMDGDGENADAKYKADYHRQTMPHADRRGHRRET